MRFMKDLGADRVRVIREEGSLDRGCDSEELFGFRLHQDDQRENSEDGAEREG